MITWLVVATSLEYFLSIGMVGYLIKWLVVGISLEYLLSIGMVGYLIKWLVGGIYLEYFLSIGWRDDYIIGCGYLLVYWKGRIDD